MKTIKLKHSLASGGRFIPQHPGAQLGHNKVTDCITIAVTGLPDTATLQDAIKAADKTVLPAGVYTFDVSQAGKILYPKTGKV